MNASALVATARRIVRGSRLIQIGILAAFWGLGEAIARGLALPVPGGVVGLALILALLIARRLDADNLRSGAHFLLAEMLLFFVPAVLAVRDHNELMSLLGLKVLAVLLGGTLLVMAATALVVDVCYRAERHVRR